MNDERHRTHILAAPVDNRKFPAKVTDGYTPKIISPVPKKDRRVPGERMPMFLTYARQNFPENTLAVDIVKLRLVFKFQLRNSYQITSKYNTDHVFRQKQEAVL